MYYAKKLFFNARFFLANGDNLSGDIVGSGELLNLRWIPIDEAQELPMPGIQEIVLKQLAENQEDMLQVAKPKRVPIRRMRYGQRVEEYE